MKGEIHATLGPGGCEAVAAWAAQHDVSAAEVIRMGLRALGITIPDVRGAAHQKGRVRRENRAHLSAYLGEEGVAAVDAWSDSTGVPKARLVRRGLEALGVQLPPVRRAGNPTWVRRGNDG